MLVDTEFPRLILASTSPRRRMLLEQIGIPFDVVPPDDGSEKTPSNDDFVAVVTRNAFAKAASVAVRFGNRIVLGADTLVELDNQALGKPGDEADAHRMLKLLSGRDHFVHTGIAVIDGRSGERHLDSEVSRVFFRRLTDDEIEAYIRSGEPMDKAGSYGIQERGAVFISRVEGCFFNVMGLPLAKLWEILLILKNKTIG
jgi:septum formation protein